MAQRSRRSERQHGHERGHENDRDGNGNHDGYGRHPHRGDGNEEESGDNPARQAAIIAQRWVGSVPPSYELYARARQQWLKLPGAMAHSAADVQMPAAPTTPTPLLKGPGRDDGEGTP